MNLKNLIFLLLLVVPYFLNAQCVQKKVCGDLTIDIAPAPGSPNIFCIGERVELVNRSGEVNNTSIDSTFYDWGDGNITKVGGAGDAFHIYRLPNDTCLAMVEDEVLSFSIKTTIIKECADGLSRNCQVNFVTIRVRPVAEFTIPPGICPDEETTLANTTCENGEEISYSWLVDGANSIEEDFLASFPKGGFYPARLIATNECGADTAALSLRVLDVPTTEITTSATPESGCTPVVVRFESTSDYATSYDWQFEPNSGVTFIDSTFDYSPDPIVQISEADTFDISLISSNKCGKDTNTLMIPVFDIPQASLRPVQNETFCEEAIYTPDIQYEGSVASLRWVFENGQPAESDEYFPKDVLFDQAGTHQITAYIEGPCGRDTVSESITVIAKSAIVFDAPEQICTSSDPFTIGVNVSGGIWTGECVDENGLFDPTCISESKEVTLTYRVGNEDCQTIETLTLEVLTGLEATIPIPSPICLKSEPDTIAVSVESGTGFWKGTGIVDSIKGLFDPAIAGIGAHILTYQLPNPANGCVTEKMTTINVLSVPILPAVDSFSTCEVDATQNLDLFVFGGDLSQKEDGIYTYSGEGVSENGQFNSNIAGQGLHDISLNYAIFEGCDTTIHFKMKVVGFVQAEAGDSQTVCQSQEMTSLIGKPVGGMWVGEGINEETGEIDLSKLEAGQTYKYTYLFEPNPACKSEDKVNVMVIGGDGVKVGEDQFICETELTTILEGASDLNGVWEGEGILNGSKDVILNALKVDSAYTYTFIATDLPEGCNSDTKTLTVSAQPNPIFDLDATACINTPIQLESVAEADNFKWTFSDGSNGMGQGIDKIFTQKGFTEITLEVSTNHPKNKNQLLCTNRQTKSIFIQEPPESVDFDLAILGDNNCAPVEIDLTNNSSGDDLHIIWLMGKDTISQDFNPTKQTLTSGVEDTTYTIKMSVNNNCGDSTQQKEVTVLASTKANFGVTFNQPCSGDSLYVNNLSTGSPQSFQWNFSTGESFDMENPPVVIPFTDTLPKDLYISLEVENQCNTSTKMDTVQVNPTDVRALIHLSDREICIGDTLFLRNIGTLGAPAYFQIEDGNSYVKNEVAHVFQEVDTFGIVLYLEGCGFDSTLNEVIVHPKPSIELQQEKVACQFAPAEFEIKSDAVGFQLFFGDGDSTFRRISNHIYSEAGTFFLKASAISNKQCITQLVDSIVVAGLPLPEIKEIKDSACAKEPIFFKAELETGNSCHWLFGDGNFAEGCEVNHQFQSSAFYTARLTITSEEGCQDSISNTLYVRPTPQAAFAFEIIEDCSPATVVFQDSSTEATGISWAVAGQTANTNNFEASFSEGGTKNVQLIATNNGICFDTAFQTIQIFDPPSLAFDLEENCQKEEGTDLIIQNESNAFVEVTGANYNMPGTFHAGLSSGAYTILASSPADCEATLPLNILEIQELEIALNQDSFDIKLGESVTLEVEPNQTGVLYEWLPSEDLTDNTSNSISVKPDRTTVYTVLVTNELDCKKIAEAFVHVEVDREDRIFIPNSFTPNGDGYNDRFRIRVANPAVVHINYFIVFDKWGNTIWSAEDFEPNSVRGEWEGLFKGKDAEMAIYTYQASIEFSDGFIQEKKGAVHLIR